MILLSILLSVSILTTHPLLSEANIGVDVRDLKTGEVVEQYRSDNVIPPASVMKLLTTSCALEVLGEGFRFETALQWDDTNLYIVGSADPSLSASVESEFVRAVREAGIQRIPGRVVADMSCLSADATNPAWLYEDVSNYYAPGIFGINYLSNTMNIVLRSGELGGVAEVLRTEPSIPGLQFSNHIRCTQITMDGAAVHGLPFSSERFLTGAIPSKQGAFCIRGDIPNPGLLLAQRLTRALRNAGISVEKDADYTLSRRSNPSQTIHTHRSDTLAALVRETNVNSNNLYAESIFRYLATRYSTPGTIAHSQDFIRDFWQMRIPSLRGARILDGCGLAPQDAVSPSQFVTLLRYMDSSIHHDAWWASLPVSGQSGTLRSLGAGTALQGRVWAKSGTISGTKNYAGYMRAASGRMLVFCVMVNSAACRCKQIQAVIQNYLLDLYRTH